MSSEKQVEEEIQHSAQLEHQTRWGRNCGMTRRKKEITMKVWISQSVWSRSELTDKYCATQASSFICTINKQPKERFYHEHEPEVLSKAYEWLTPQENSTISRSLMYCIRTKWKLYGKFRFFGGIPAVLLPHGSLVKSPPNFLFVSIVQYVWNRKGRPPL